MRYQPRQAAVVEALEWKGDNLREMQDFVAPESPLTHSKDGIGLNVYTGAQYMPTTLCFAKVGDMVIKTDGKLAIQSKAEFDRLYEPTEEGMLV